MSPDAEAIEAESAETKYRNKAELARTMARSDVDPITRQMANIEMLQAGDKLVESSERLRGVIRVLSERTVGPVANPLVEALAVGMVEEVVSEAARLKAENARFRSLLIAEGFNLDTAEDEGAPSEPGRHPEDPGGMDHWELGFCEHCSAPGAQLVQKSHCGDPECSGCMRECLACSERRYRG